MLSPKSDIIHRQRNGSSGVNSRMIYDGVGNRNEHSCVSLSGLVFG